MWRRVTEDTEIAGVQVPKGSMLMARYAAGNRDGVFPNPPAWMSLAATPVSTWHCTVPTFTLGAQLARLELQVALEQLLDRTDNWQLVETELAGQHHPNVLLRRIDGATHPVYRYSRAGRCLDNDDFEARCPASRTCSTGRRLRCPNACASIPAEFPRFC